MPIVVSFRCDSRELTHVRLLIAHLPRYQETSTAALTTPVLTDERVVWNLRLHGDPGGPGTARILFYIIIITSLQWVPETLSWLVRRPLGIR